MENALLVSFLLTAGFFVGVGISLFLCWAFGIPGAVFAFFLWLWALMYGVTA